MDSTRKHTRTKEMDVEFINGDSVSAALTAREVTDSLAASLAGGIDPESGAPRTRVETTSGTFMQMPATNGSYVGTKLLTITPENSTTESPVIQGLYALFGSSDQRPLAILDGIALTNRRTSGVSAFCAGLVAKPGPKRLLIFGTGVQAWEHIMMFSELFDIVSVEIMGRNRHAVDSVVERAREAGLDASAGTTASIPAADIILCCTASARPLFDGAKVGSGAVVVAIGSHDRDHRELDDGLLARSNVCVESLDSALREAGDVIQALESGAIADRSNLITMADLVLKRRVVAEGKPVVFKTTGMPWQDLAVAVATYRAIALAAE